MKLVTIDDFKNLTQEDYNLAKEIAKKEFIRLNYGKNFGGSFYSTKLGYKREDEVEMAKKIIDTDFMGLNYPTKYLIASNIALMDDDAFISQLINFNYSYNHLLPLSTCFKKLINKEEVSTNEMNHINRLTSVLKKYYNLTDFELIYGKLLEVIVFKKEEYINQYEVSKNKYR